MAGKRSADPPAAAGGSEPEPKGEGRGAQTRNAILEAAIVRFGRDGFRGTSVADIARDAGVGGTITYAYFPNKEALFLAALDEDAARVIGEGVSVTAGGPANRDWNESLMATLVGAVERHPLARRVLAGLEPHATDRMLDIPALTELRKAVAERLRAGQLDGTVRSDIDPVSMANGLVAITLSLLMSVLQFGSEGALPYADDVLGVVQAAVERAPEPPAR
jgi:AcrR family transcriptional regulator